MNKHYNKLCLTVFLFLFVASALSQEVDLFKEKDEKTKDIVTSVFKSSRIVNGQSIENVGNGVLSLKILHRFGNINQGAYNLFGLDQASMRIGLDYGVNNRLMIGVGRSTFEKQYDAFFKYKLVQQQTGLREIPVSVSLASTVMYKSLKDAPNATYLSYASDKFTFAYQIIIARKFNDYFSFQLTPTLMHYNLATNSTMPKDLKSLGISFRQRITKRLNFTTEYFYRVNKIEGYNDPLTFGLDIETGGHVFQLHVTNSTGMTERTFINETTGSWANGDVRFGFNINRAFTLKKPKELRSIKW